MKPVVLVSAGVLTIACSSMDILGIRGTTDEPTTGGEGGADPLSNEGTGGAYPVDSGTDLPSTTGGSLSSGGSPTVVVEEEEEDWDLPNLLEERQDIPITQVNAMVNDAFSQLFFGFPVTEAVFRDQGDGTAYIEDIYHGDVRTDSMGYGMLTTVQLNQREVFDKLWAWAKANMMPTSGPSAGLVFWRCDTSGANCEEEAATDAMSIITTSLFMAQSRWAAAGRHDYQGDAHALLDVMTEIEDRNGGVIDGVVNCFDLTAELPREGSKHSNRETPVDYLMPAFYEIWARRDPGRADLWRRMADNARTILSQASHAQTGLYPEFVTFDGEPVPGNAYRPTTSRTLLNLTLDYLWFGGETWIVEQNERLLDFFLSQGVDSYVEQYELDGTPLVTYNTAAHRSLVALAAGTSARDRYDVFLEVLIDEPIPTGAFRYYDGMLYMLSLMVLSGQILPE